MSYSNQFRGSPWQCQQDRQLFEISRYGQIYRGYGLSNQFSVASSYGYNQERVRSMYGSGAFSSLRSMEYGNPSLYAYYPSDRMSSYQGFQGQIQQKRLPERISSAGPRSKRPKLENGSRQESSRIQWRRRRGSRRLKKKSNKSDGKVAETVTSVTNINYAEYNNWKSSEDENETSVSKDKQQSADDVEKTEMEEDELDEIKVPKKPLACHVCKVICSNLERLGNHMISRTHRSKMEMLLTLQQEKKQVKEASMKASKQVESQDRTKKERKKQGHWCTVCEDSFSETFFAHRRTKEHKKNRDKKFPKCRPCAISFNSAEEYREHCKGQQHKVKSAEFHFLKNLASGSDEDTAAIEPVKVQTPSVIEEGEKTAEATEGKEKPEEKKEVGDSKAVCEQSDIIKKAEPVGALFVVLAKGYYCKICRKFFKDVSVAKVKHCCSIMHNEAFKKAMKEAMEKEEERQRLANEQERLELEAEVAKKKTPKANDTESEKSSNQSGDGSVEKMEASDVASERDGSKRGDVEVTGEEMKGNTTVEEMKVPKTENGVKKDETQVTGGKISVKEVKGKTEIPPAAVSVAEEKPHEIVLSDGQGDKGGEGTKKESPGSHGTKRSRGRGRRR